jgi:hypothetical protein
VGVRETELIVGLAANLSYVVKYARATELKSLSSDAAIVLRKAAEQAQELARLHALAATPAPAAEGFGDPHWGPSYKQPWHAAEAREPEPSKPYRPVYDTNEAIAAHQAQGAAVDAEPQTGSWVAADDVYRMAREIDVALNGEAGAAKRPALCDVTAQIKRAARERGPLLAPPTPARSGEDVR